MCFCSLSLVAFIGPQLVSFMVFNFYYIDALRVQKIVKLGLVVEIALPIQSSLVRCGVVGFP